MSEDLVLRPLVRYACGTWDTATSVASVAEPVVCRSALMLPGTTPDARFCFVSVGSPLEQLISDGTKIYDHNGGALSVAELADRLLDDEVAAVLAPRGPVSSAASGIVPILPQALHTRRQRIRRDNVLARFLLRQIGLEEVSSHRGAAPDLYERISDLWSHDLALCTDPAMLLTLGSDRQRHVDVRYKERAKERLPRAVHRLSDQGVRSYPRLVII